MAGFSQTIPFISIGVQQKSIKVVGWVVPTRIGSEPRVIINRSVFNFQTKNNMYDAQYCHDRNYVIAWRRHTEF